MRAARIELYIPIREYVNSAEITGARQFRRIQIRRAAETRRLSIAIRRSGDRFVARQTKALP